MFSSSSLLSVSFFFGIGMSGTCNFADSIFGGLAVDVCDQVDIEFAPKDSLYECVDGSDTEINEFIYEQDSGCTGAILDEADQVGVCNNPKTGCNLYLVEVLIYTENADCTGETQTVDPISFVVTDGAANRCGVFNELSDVDINGFTVTNYNDENCQGPPAFTVDVKQGCNVGNIFPIVSLYAEISEYVGEPYVGVDMPMRYEDAQAYCESRYGTNLATINSEADNEAVRDAADDADAMGELLWIGLNDLDDDSELAWEDGSGVGYTNFYEFSGLPKAGPRPEKKCIAMNGDKDDQWVPRTCDNEFPFVCINPNGAYA